MSPLYLYALLGARPRRAPGRGLRREPVRILPVRDLFVAAGKMPAAPPVARATLRGHDATVRRLAASVDALLPARFGAVVADEAALARLLGPRAARLRRTLELVAGREQMTLRVYAAGRVAAPSRRLPPGRSFGRGPGARYLSSRLRAHARAQHVPEIEPVRAALAGLVRAERVERHAEPPLLATVYHLVDRGASRRYLAAIRPAARRLRGIRVRASGPWPPYGFAAEGVE